MRWEYKPKTVYDRIKKRFALFPVIVNTEWVWLESYYSYTLEGYAGPEVSRFSTYQEAVDWLDQLEAT